jgi:hypothetical protein
MQATARVRLDALVGQWERIKDLGFQIKSAAGGGKLETLRSDEAFRVAREQAAQDLANAQRDAAIARKAVRAPLPTRGKWYESFQGALDTVQQGLGLRTWGEDDRRQLLREKLGDAESRVHEAQERAKTLAEEQARVKQLDLENEKKVTAELEHQLALAKARTDVEKLKTDRAGARRKLVEGNATEGQLEVFDRTTSQQVLNLNRKQNAEFKAALDSVTALTERQRARAQYEKAIADAAGDVTKTKQAEVVLAAQLLDIDRREKQAATEKRNEANDYLQRLREQLAIARDLTGETEKGIRKARERGEAEVKGGKEALDIVRQIQKAQERAEVRGTTGQYVGGHMDKGIARRRALQHKATHERKWRSSAFYRPEYGGPEGFDEEGNLLPDQDSGGLPGYQGVTLGVGQDFDFIRRHAGTRKKPGGGGKRTPSITGDTPSTGAPRAPGAITGEGVAQAAGQVADAMAGAAEASKLADESMKKAADEAKKEREAIEGMSKATGDVKQALTENATAQEKTAAAIHDLVTSTVSKIVKLSKDHKDLKQLLDRAVGQLKAAP